MTMICKFCTIDLDLSLRSVSYWVGQTQIQLFNTGWANEQEILSKCSTFNTSMKEKSREISPFEIY